MEFLPFDDMMELKIRKRFKETNDVTLFQGDCLDLLATMPNGVADLIVTSPPYNLGKPYEKRLNLDIYAKQQHQVISECARILSDQGSICWEVGNYVKNGEIVPLDVLLYPSFIDCGLSIKEQDRLALRARSTLQQAILRTLRGYNLVYKN